MENGREKSRTEKNRTEKSRAEKNRIKKNRTEKSRTEQKTYRMSGGEKEKAAGAESPKAEQKKGASSAKCPYQKKCGGCTYLKLSYEEQLAKKEQFLKKTLKGIVPVKGMVGMENPYHYRNKVNSAFARKKDGTIVSGIYEKGTHKIVTVE